MLAALLLLVLLSVAVMGFGVVGLASLGGAMRSRRSGANTAVSSVVIVLVWSDRASLDHFATQATRWCGSGLGDVNISDSGGENVQVAVVGLCMPGGCE